MSFIKIAFFILVTLLSVQVWAGAIVSYHGRITTPDGLPLENMNVIFKIQVRSPGAPSCLLYEEMRSVNMSGSKGLFVIPIGDGGGTRTFSDPGITVENVFSNNSALNFNALSCNSGSSYSPVSLDSRKLVVSFDDGSGAGPQVLAPMDINYIPLALHSLEAQTALKVGATPAANVMTVSGPASPLSPSNFVELLALVNGSSSTYAKTSSSVGGDLSGTLASANVVKLQNHAVSSSAPSNNDVLTWNGTSWTPQAPSGGGAVTSVAGRTGVVTLSNTDISGLGNSATKNVGTAAGTVAAGDDARFGTASTFTGSFSGDVSGTTSTTSVDKIKNIGVTYTSITGGDFLKYNGSAWVNTALSSANLSDGGTLLKSSNMPGNCSASQTLTFSSPSGVWVCSTIAGLDANVLTTGTIADGRLPASAKYWQAAAGGINYAGGNVGIGTATPSKSLEVVGNISGGLTRIQNTSTSGYSNLMMADSGGATVGYVGYANPSASSFADQVYFGSVTAKKVGLVANGAQAVTIDTTGNVGIGTTAPAVKLHVEGPSWVAQFSSGSTALSVSGNQIAANASDPLLLNASHGGNVGIGTLTPDARFVVSSNATALPAAGLSGTLLRVANTDAASSRILIDTFGAGSAASPNLTLRSSSGTAASRTATAIGDVLGQVSWVGHGSTGYRGGAGTAIRSTATEAWSDTANGASLEFYTVGNGTTPSTEKMRIDSTGNVGIGTQTPTAKLEVSGQIVSRAFDNGGGMSFDFNNGNSQYTTASCGAMTLSNMVDGGSYIVAILGTTSGTCTFSHAGLTFFSNYSGPTNEGTRSLVSFQRVGAYVFVNWNTGYQ